MRLIRSDYFLFGLVFIKKKSKLVFLKKPEIEPKSISIRFNYFEKNQFKLIDSVFSGLAWFFSGFFSYRAIPTSTLDSYRYKT